MRVEREVWTFHKQKLNLNLDFLLVDRSLDSYKVRTSFLLYSRAYDH